MNSLLLSSGRSSKSNFAKVPTAADSVCCSLPDRKGYLSEPDRVPDDSEERVEIKV
jgi:hypothetical protein